MSTHKASSDRDMRPNLVPPHDEDLPPMTAITDDLKLWYSEARWWSGVGGLVIVGWLGMTI